MVCLNGKSDRGKKLLENVLIKCQHELSEQPAVYCNFDKCLHFHRSKASHMACEKEIWQKIGEGFVQEYYNQFDNTNRMGLGNLYVRLFSVHLIIACFDKVKVCNINMRCQYR